MAKKKDIQSDPTSDVLTAFETQFVDIWFNMGFNGRLAYKQLKPNVLSTTADTEASKLLSLPKIQDYIELKKEQLRMKEEIKLDFLVHQLTGIVLTEDTEEIERDGQGNILKTRTKTNNTARIQAMNLLSKLGGLETKKVEMKIDGNISLKEMLGFDDE
jgi:hypothetical protein